MTLSDQSVMELSAPAAPPAPAAPARESTLIDDDPAPQPMASSPPATQLDIADLNDRVEMLEALGRHAHALGRGAREGLRRQRRGPPEEGRGY